MNDPRSRCLALRGSYKSLDQLINTIEVKMVHTFSGKDDLPATRTSLYEAILEVYAEMETLSGHEKKLARPGFNAMLPPQGDT